MDLQGKFIASNVKPLAALEILKKFNQQSIIYPLRGPRKQVQQYGGLPPIEKSELIADPVNHVGGSPMCTQSLHEWKSTFCNTCRKEIPKNDWYLDLTLQLIINQYSRVMNKKDIVECVKFYNDGEYEILYTEFQDALIADAYVENDPIINALAKVQAEIVKKAENNANIILEQNPILMEEFTKIIDDALV